MMGRSAFQEINYMLMRPGSLGNLIELGEPVKLEGCHFA